jgi:Tfp pilus assembly protein PilZ
MFFKCKCGFYSTYFNVLRNYNIFINEDKVITITCPKCFKNIPITFSYSKKNKKELICG